MVSTSFMVDTFPAPSLRNLLCAVNCALTELQRKTDLQAGDQTEIETLRLEIDFSSPRRSRLATQPQPATAESLARPSPLISPSQSCGCRTPCTGP